jgi:zinc transporter ZupT
MGSLVGVSTRLRPIIISILAAFGAGALIAALSVELVAPTMAALVSKGGDPNHGDPHLSFYALIVGAILGGIFFVVLDQVVNAHGGFLRKTAPTLSHFRIHKRRRMRELLEELSRVSILHNVPAYHGDHLVEMVRPVTFRDGEVVFKPGDKAAGLYLIREGTISIREDDQPIAEIKASDVAGLVPLVTDTPQVVTGIARGTTKCLQLSKKDFEQLRRVSPELDEACRDLASERLEKLERFHASQRAKADRWVRQTVRALRMGTEIPTSLELRRTKQDYQAAPLAIWLGILLDGIPESLVIGAGFLVLLQSKVTAIGSVNFAEVIPFTLIAGLFLSNFPEALSSSANMYNQGWGKGRVFFMWFSLMVITGVGAGLGYLLGGVLSSVWLIFAEGMAAGAMITMIASSMIPEAVHLGKANTVGLSTLAGFIAAISFKLLE